MTVAISEISLSQCWSQIKRAYATGSQFKRFTLRGPEVLILAVMMHLITYILCITRVQMFYDRCFVKGRQEFKIQIGI